MDHMREHRTLARVMGVGREQHELNNLYIYDKMNNNINCCPQNNYEVFASLVKFAKVKHLPSKIVKYNKRKHMKSKWMADGILKSINTKDKLYKIIIQTRTQKMNI